MVGRVLDVFSTPPCFCPFYSSIPTWNEVFSVTFSPLVTLQFDVDNTVEPQSMVTSLRRRSHTVMRLVLLVLNAHRTYTIHVYSFIHKAVTSIIHTTATQSHPTKMFFHTESNLVIQPALYQQSEEFPWTFDCTSFNHLDYKCYM